MPNLRITTELWVSILRKRLETNAIPVFIIQKGEKQAGAIIIRVSNLRGRSTIFIQAPSINNERRWVELMEGLDRDIEEMLQKQKKFDADLWILEIEIINSDNLFNDFLLLG